MPQKIIVLLIISILCSPYTALPTIKAADTPTTNKLDTSAIPDDGNGEEDPNVPEWSGVITSNKQKPAVHTMAQIVDEMQSQRIGGQSMEQTLPRIGMSQCDQKLVKDGKIDERVLESLNYLVKPVEKGGAGITYLHVTFSKQCEEEVPELLGGAYPVVFEGETEDPNNPGYPLINSRPNSQIIPKSSNTPSTTSSIEPGGIKSVVGIYTQQQYKRFSELAKVIAPLANAASTKSVDVEPAGVENVHAQGQAADIMAAGLLMCVTKSGGVAGIGAKSSRQAPRPIKVAWQTDKGVSNVNTPFGNNFDQMANTAGLDAFLEGFTSQDGTFRAQALQSAFTMMGFSLIANQLGIKPSTFNADTAPLNYQTLGYAMLADLMDLPDMSVFDPFANSGISQTNPLQTKRDNVETLLKTTLMRKFEQDLKLPAGSLDGDTVEDVMTNAAKRRLEKDMGLSPRSLSGNLENPTEILRSIGQAKMESFYHLPIGSANTSKINNGSILSGLIDNTASLLNLPANQRAYAESVVRASLNLPSTVSLGDLTNANSGFWKNDSKSKTVSDQLKAFDKQLYPKDNTPDLTQSGAVSVIDDIRRGSFDNLTFRIITNNMSMVDYQKVVGLGALLNQYGIYSGGGSNGSNGRAVDFPPDRNKYGVVKGVIVAIGQFETVQELRRRYNDPTATIVVPPRNEFLTHLLQGDKNYWVALGVNVVAQSLQMNPDDRLKITSTPGWNGTDTDTRTGMVMDAIAGGRTFNFSASRINLSISLSPSEFLTIIGAGLAKDKSSSDAKRLSDQRANAIINMAKDRFGYSFNSMASKAVGDRELLNLLYAYDQKREAARDAVEVFTVTDHNKNTFTLSNRAISVKGFEMIDREGAPLVAPQHTISSDGYTVSVPNNTFTNLLGDVTVRITYSTYAKKAGQPSQISPDLFLSLFNNPSVLSTLAIQLGAAKMSKALNLPTNALGMAAQLLSGGSSSGVTGIGQAALEQNAGVAIGTLTGGTIKQLLDSGKLTRDQLNRMLLLEAGWYDKIAAGDENFINYNSPALYRTDEYYKIEYGSTLDLLTNKITIDAYKKRLGQSNLRYNMGGVLAAQFSIHVAGYRLSGQDFYDILSGEWYKVGMRIGARAQERNHNLPINALATVLLTGKTTDALSLLASNVVASAFHLKSLDLTNVTSIAQVKSSIGRSTIEQALGFDEGSFIDGNALDVARRVGAEKFATAFGIILPQYVSDQLKQVNYSYHADLAQKDRDTIIFNYLNTILANGSGVATEQIFGKSTLARFEQIDYSLGIEKGSTVKFVLCQISSSDYITRTGQKAVDDGIQTQLAHLLGVPDSYIFEGKAILDAIKNNKLNDLRSVAEGWGGKFVDAQIGWTDGTFKTIAENINDSVVIKRVISTEGSKILARMTNLPEDSFSFMFAGNYSGAGASLIASQINVPGFSVEDASNMLNGHFTDGMQLVGAALMSQDDTMKNAGITYADLKASLYGDLSIERQTIIDLVAKGNPGLDPAMIATDQEFAWVFDPTKQNFTGQSYVEAAKRDYMNQARQNVTYKYLDYQAKQLLPPEFANYIQPGFAKALVGGSYSYIDPSTGNRINLTGDEARWRYAKDFFTSYAVNNIPILKDLGMAASTLQILTDYTTSHMGDDKWLESALMANNGLGFADLGRNLDKLTQNVFKIDFAPGTGAALIGYSFDGDMTKLGNNLWSAWQLKALSWADDALGLQPGTASLMYQGITSYQSALSAYREASFAATDLVMSAAATGDLATFDAAMTQASGDMSSASRQFNTQTAMIIASVANIVFQKQFSQIEGALGLAPGTLIYLIQYLISPDPISLGLFIFFNFVWGGTSTKCAIDKYPDGDPFNMNNVIQSQARIMNNLINSPNSTIDINSTEMSQSANPIDKKLLPPGTFRADNNDSYRAGIKAGAQYEVRRTIGSLLIMRLRTGNDNIKPLQIGTLSEEDVNLFEPISARAELYGPLATRPEKIGTGWFDKTVDRIHIGY